MHNDLHGFSSNAGLFFLFIYCIQSISVRICPSYSGLLSWVPQARGKGPSRRGSRTISALNICPVETLFEKTSLRKLVRALQKCTNFRVFSLKLLISEKLSMLTNARCTVKHKGCLDHIEGA